MLNFINNRMQKGRPTMTDGQTVAAFLGLIVAIAVPAWLEWRRQHLAKSDLKARRAAAYRVMKTVVGELSVRQHVSRGEISSIGAVLASIDPLILPEQAVAVLVRLRGRISTAGAETDAVFNMTTYSQTTNPFDGLGASKDVASVMRILTGR